MYSVVCPWEVCQFKVIQNIWVSVVVVIYYRTGQQIYIHGPTQCLFTQCLFTQAFVSDNTVCVYDVCKLLYEQSP